jgi:hypothetical protein
MVAASLTIVTLTEFVEAAGELAAEAEAAGELLVEAFEPEQALKIPTARRAAPTAGRLRMIRRLEGRLGRSVPRFMDASLQCGQELSGFDAAPRPVPSCTPAGGAAAVTS